MWAHDYPTANKLSDVCEDIVTRFLKESDASADEKIKGIDSALKIVSKDKDGNDKVVTLNLLQYVNKYDNFAFWRKHSAKYSNIDMD